MPEPASRGILTRLLAVLLLTATPALAQPGPRLPTLFDVAGVSAGDGLNVRAAPDAAAEVVGRLAADARGIEVVGLDASGRWGRINLGEGSGWAAMRYLAEREGVWPVDGLPDGLACFGNEPFWSLAPGAEAVTFSTPEAPARALGLVAALATGIEGDPRRALVAADAAGRLTATIAPAACSDGMSDRAFGLAAMVVLEGSGEPLLVTGCCSLAR